MSIIFLVPLLCSSLKISTPKQGISITSLLLSTLPNLDIPVDSTNSCIVDGLPPEHLTTHKLHPIINARFLWISIGVPGDLTPPTQH